MFSQTIAYGLLVGAMYGLITLGLGLLMGVMKFLNVAHGTFIVVGGYISYWLFTLYGINPYLSIPLVIAVMFLLGVVIYRVTLSPLLKLPSLGNRINSSMLITFGIIYVMDNLMTIFWKPDVRSIVAPFTGSSIELLGTRLSVTGLCGFAVAVLVAVSLVIESTPAMLGGSRSAEGAVQYDAPFQIQSTPRYSSSPSLLGLTGLTWKENVHASSAGNPPRPSRAA